MTKIVAVLFSSLCFFTSVVQARQDSVHINLYENFSNTRPEIRELLLFAVEGALEEPFLEFELINTGHETHSNLYIEINISSDHNKLLARIIQDASKAITIGGESTLRFTNQDIKNQFIPGLPDPMQFSFVLPEQGRQLLNDLKDDQFTPAGSYHLTISLFERENGSTNGSLVTSETFTLGSGFASNHPVIRTDEESIRRLSNLDLSKERPVFRWEGSPYRTYRLVVIEDLPDRNTGRLLQHSFNQTYEGSIRTSLAEFEYLDVRVTDNQYIFPEMPGKQLDHGKSYAWQVKTVVQTPSGEQEATSEIRRFSLNIPIEGEVKELFIRLLGQSATDQMIESGLQLDEIEIGGTTLSDRNAVEYLTQLLEKSENNKIVFTNNETRVKQ